MVISRQLKGEAQTNTHRQTDNVGVCVGVGKRQRESERQLEQLVARTQQLHLPEQRARDT